MFCVGLDVHQKRSSVCILDSRGKKVKEFEVVGSWDRLIEELAKLPRPMAVCFEASTGCGWLCDKLLPIARRVEVAHPGRVRMIFRSKKKNDRVDARKLAMLLLLNQVPKAYIPDARVRGWRGLVEFRRRTVFDRDASRRRNVIDQCIGWLKHARRIATQYEKTAVNFLAILKLTMIQHYFKTHLRDAI